MFDKNRIMKIEFTERYDGLEVEYVALFDKDTPEEEARMAIELHGVDISINVIIITKKQFENVFKQAQKPEKPD